MKCKKCKRVIPDNSIFCNWCGEKQLKQKDAVSVPKPTKLKNGTYSAQIMVDGQRIRVTGKTEAEYTKNARAVKEQLVDIKVNPKLSAAAAIDKYIESRTEVLSASTIRGYRIIQRGHFLAVSDIATADWQSLVNAESRTYSPKTMRNAWRLMASVLRDNGLPVPNVILPQLIPHEREFLQPEEIKPYLQAVEGKECELPALLALCSLRQSELLALSWEDIDLAAGTISVNGAMVPNEDHKYILQAETKNMTSRRTVPMLIPRIRELLQAVPEPERTGRLITLHPSTIRRQLISVREDITLHCLRHTFCSLAYSLGLSELECMKLGGWSSPETMRKIYTHLSDADRSQAGEKLMEFYS